MNIKKGEKPEADLEDGQDNETFLRRWTRRKSDAAVKTEAPELEPEAREDPVRPGDEPARERADDAAEAEAPAVGDAETREHKGDEDMPPLESIDEGGSVAEFFSPRVSQGLRRAALRRLFAQSRLPVGDDLDDYAGDYTNLTKLGDLVTNEMRHRFEVVRQRLAKRAEERLAKTDSTSGAASPPSATGAIDPAEAEETPSTADEKDDEEPSEHDRNLD